MPINNAIEQDGEFFFEPDTGLMIGYRNPRTQNPELMLTSAQTAAVAAPSGVSQTIYVTLGGSDSTGRRGGVGNPFRTLRAAVAATGITAGDVIQLGPGTFDETGTGNGIVIPEGVHLRGSGMLSTVIDLSDVTGVSAKVMLTCGVNTDNSDFTLLGKTVFTAGGNFPLGYATGMSWPTKESTVFYRRIRVNAYSDNIFISGTAPFYRQNWRFFDCDFISAYDAVLMVGGSTFADAILDFFNCNFTITWNGTDVTPVSRLLTGMGDRYYVNFWNCKLRSYSAGTRYGAVAEVSGGSTAHGCAFYNCDFSEVTTSNGANNYVMKAAGASSSTQLMLVGCKFPSVTYLNDVGAANYNAGNPLLPGAIPVLNALKSLPNGGAAAVGTLTNAPTAGNPTKWLAINDAGVTRYIPVW